MPDDAELLRRYVATLDQQAFAELVRRHVDAVFSAALRRVGGDVHFAEDVTQQVFAALARKASEVSRHPFLGGWLYTTTRNEAANVVRRERRRKAREQSASALKTNADESGAAQADWQHLAPVLDDAIDTLAEPDRTAIVLRFIERRGFSEIGTALEVSTDAARMRVERALEKLRQRLVRRGVTSTAGALGIALTAHAASPAPCALAASVTSAALASATVATGVTPWIAFMGLTKLHTTLVATALLVGGAAYYGQHLVEEQQSRHSAARAALAAVSARADTTWPVRSLKQRRAMPRGNDGLTRRGRAGLRRVRPRRFRRPATRSSISSGSRRGFGRASRAPIPSINDSRAKSRGAICGGSMGRFIRP